MRVLGLNCPPLCVCLSSYCRLQPPSCAVCPCPSIFFIYRLAVQNLVCVRLHGGSASLCFALHLPAPAIEPALCCAFHKNPDGEASSSMSHTQVLYRPFPLSPWEGGLFLLAIARCPPPYPI